MKQILAWVGAVVHFAHRGASAQQTWYATASRAPVFPLLGLCLLCAPSLAAHENEEILRLLDLHAGQIVADIGCGGGRISEVVAGAVGPEGTVYAVEISARSIRTVTERGIPNVFPILSVPDDVTLAAGSIDVAFMHDVASHVKEEVRPEFYASVARALKPEGLLVIFGHHDHTHRILEEIARYGFVPENDRELAQLSADELDERMLVGVRFRHVPGQCPFDIELVESILSVTGRYDSAERALELEIPRADVAVEVEGRKLDPAKILVSRANLRAAEDSEATLTGEIVLFEDELDGAVDTALEHGLIVTALHDHLLLEEPDTRFLHVRGTAAAEHLARGFRAVLDAVATLRSSEAPSDRDLDAESYVGHISAGSIAEVLGFAVTSRAGGLELALAAPRSGATTHATFTGGDDRALVEGSLDCFAGELRPVLIALRRHGMHVVAVEPPIGDEPATVVRFRAAGRARELALAVRAAIDAQRAARKY